MKKSEEQRRVEEIVKRVKKNIGYSGWVLLGPNMRQAVVRAEALCDVAAGASFEDSFGGRLAALAVQWDGEAE